MPKLPVLSGKEIIKALAKMGFEEIRQKGSHVILKKQKATGEAGCVVPLHKEVALGTLKGILKQASVSVEEFINVLK
ncbi:MAG: type II toxin-antitoxin system HicA family toxin [Cyclobacteriaceae bacterium]|nr:type II toxin-antitoxin system HicA family toxin [Cyclobacteriaceae bacterium]